MTSFKKGELQIENTNSC